MGKNNGSNQRIDVKVIQAALNLVVHPDFKLDKPLVVDGRIGSATYKVIEEFQAKVAGLKKPDGRIDPNGQTLRTLRSHITKGLNGHSILAIMGHGRESRILPYLPSMETEFPTYSIDTPLRQAHFLAQVGHESLSFTYTQELATGEAYEGRADLGNTEAGDGRRFKGRGLIQLTGRANYKAYGDAVGVDFLELGNETSVSSSIKHSLGAALWFWKRRRLNDLADKDDLRTITRRVNGGYNGLADRTEYLCRAKFFLMP